MATQSPPGRRPSPGRPARSGLLRHVQALAVVVLLVVLAVLGVAISAAAGARAAIATRGDRLGPANTQTVALLAAYTDEETGVRGYLVTEDPSFLAPYRAADARLGQSYAELTRLLDDRPDLLVLLERVRVSHDAWIRQAARPEIAAAGTGDFARAASIERAGIGRARFEVIRSDLAALQRGITDARDHESDVIRRAQDILLASLVAAVVLILGLTAAVLMAISRLLIRPFTEVGTAVDAVAAGDLDRVVPSSGPREVADLGTSVETMRARLVTALAESRRAVEALSQQGPAVIALRDALTPARTASTALEVEARLDPAEGVLAGDWYDALDLPGGRVGFVLGDVSGHGPGPGVFALRLKHLLSAALTAGMAPGMAVEWVVNQLGDTDEMFATVLVIVLDPGTGVLEFTNAGHPDGLILRPGRAAMRLEQTGPILSRLVAAPQAWSTRHTVLEPEDVLLAYTDGLVEARRAGRELGVTGLVSYLESREGMADRLAPRQLLDELFAFVVQYAGGEPSDDRTALAVTRVPQQATGVRAATSQHERTDPRADASAVAAGGGEPSDRVTVTGATDAAHGHEGML